MVGFGRFRKCRYRDKLDFNRSQSRHLVLNRGYDLVAEH